jgi:flagellar hook-length control protein FliK
MNSTSSISSSIFDIVPSPSTAQSQSDSDADDDRFSQELSKAQSQNDPPPAQNSTPAPVQDAKPADKQASKPRAGPKSIKPTAVKVTVAAKTAVKSAAAPKLPTPDAKTEEAEPTVPTEPTDQADASQPETKTVQTPQLASKPAFKLSSQNRNETEADTQAANDAVAKATTGDPHDSQTTATQDDPPVDQLPVAKHAPDTKAKAASDKSDTDVTPDPTTAQTTATAVAATTTAADTTTTQTPTSTDSQTTDNTTDTAPKAPICSSLGDDSDQSNKPVVAKSKSSNSSTSDQTQTASADGSSDITQPTLPTADPVAASAGDDKSHSASLVATPIGSDSATAGMANWSAPGTTTMPHGVHPIAAPVAPAPPPDAQFAETNNPAIVTAIHGQLLPSGGTMSIQLDPPELGALNVTVKIENGAISASFETSNAQATQLLSHSLGQLKHALETQGVSVDRLHVHQSSSSDTPGNSKEGGSGGKQSASEQGQAQREQQRRELMRRMWRRAAFGRDPLDLVA